MKKLGMCSVLSCQEQATKELRYKSGAVGEYCDRHYEARIKEMKELEQDPKVGDRVALIRRPWRYGTVEGFQLEDQLHSGEVWVRWDGTTTATRQHKRLLQGTTK